MRRLFLSGFLILIAALPLAAQDTPSNPAPTTNPPPAYYATPPVTPPTTMTLPSSSSGPQDELDDIRPPYFYLHSHFWLWLLLGVLALLAIIVAMAILFWPRKQLSPKTAYELALEKLEKARELMSEEKPVPYVVSVSETIRSYLGQHFQSPSTRRTTQEFLRIMEVDITSPLAEHRDLLRNFLESCDLVKFARYQPTLVELEEIHDRARGFVLATKPQSATVPQNGRGT